MIYDAKVIKEGCHLAGIAEIIGCLPEGFTIIHGIRNIVMNETGPTKNAQLQVRPYRVYQDEEYVDICCDGRVRINGEMFVVCVGPESLKGREPTEEDRDTFIEDVNDNKA